MITTHQTFEGEIGKKKTVFHIVNEKGKYKKYTDSGIDKVFGSLGPGDSVLSTSANSTDAVLLALQKRGVKVFSAHWHNTGIPSGLDPKEIAVRFSQLPTDKLRPVIARADIADLRQTVDMRQFIVKIRKAEGLQFKAQVRRRGFQDEDTLPPDLAEVEKYLNAAKNKIEGPIEKEVAEKASKIKECQVLKKIADISGPSMSCAIIVAYLGDMSRFHSVSSVWKYTGNDVVNGEAPRREKGKIGKWSTKARTALWQMGDSIIKNRKNKWFPVYQRYRNAEQLVHGKTCKDGLKCPSPKKHVINRARRRVIKDIIKEYYLAMTNQGVNEIQGMAVGFDQPFRENQDKGVNIYPRRGMKTK